MFGPIFHGHINEKLLNYFSKSSTTLTYLESISGYSLVHLVFFFWGPPMLHFRFTRGLFSRTTFLLLSSGAVWLAGLQFWCRTEPFVPRILQLLVHKSFYTKMTKSTSSHYTELMIIQLRIPSIGDLLSIMLTVSVLKHHRFSLAQDPGVGKRIPNSGTR